MRRHQKLMTMFVLIAALTVARAAVSEAHCDTMDGPVVADARTALEKKDITPVMKWISSEAEPEIRAAFDKALSVRGSGKEAAELADTYFFETLVRVHRAGEGAPYTGLKPAGAEVDAAILASDKALESGSAEELANHVAEAVRQGIIERFKDAAAKKQHADHNVDAGRAFVAAYVEFMHYVERQHYDATHSAHHGAASTTASPAHEH